MFLTKLKTTIAALLVAVTVVAGAIAVELSAVATHEPQPSKHDQHTSQKENTPQASQKTDGSAKLQKSRLDAAKATYTGTWEDLGTVWRLGNAIFPIVRPEEVFTWSVRWLNAEREMSDKRDEHIAALEEHIKRMKDIQKRVDAMTPTLLPAWSTSATAWYVADAEIGLAKEKAIQKAAEVVSVALLKARLDAAKEAYKGALENIGEVKKIGKAVLIAPIEKPDEVYAWSVRWLNAELDMSNKRDDQIAVLEEHIKRMKELQKKVSAMTPDLLPMSSNSAAVFYLAEAEIWLVNKKENLPQFHQKADAGERQKMLKARLDAAKEAFTGAWEWLGALIRLGGGIEKIQKRRIFLEVYPWSVRWLNAQRDMSDKRDDHIAASEEHIKRIKELQKRVDAMTPNLLPEWANSAAAWYVAEAELCLAKEKAK